MRRVFRILLAVSIGFGAARAAEASGQLVMPFLCDVAHGRIKLTPSPEHSYPIVGEREKQTIMRCHGPNSGGGCHALLVHRFVIACGGAGVPWMRVAEAVKRAGNAPAWVTNGRLNLVLPVSGQPAAEPPCFDRPAFALAGAGLQQRVALRRDCLPRAKRADYDHVVLPAGFAPVRELGARLVAAVPADELADVEELASEGQASLSRVSVAGGETLVAKVDADSIVDPIPGLEPYDPAFEPAAAGDEWVTVVRTEPERGRAAERTSGLPGAWSWVLLAMGLATAIGFMRTQIASALTASSLAAAASFLVHALAQMKLRRTFTFRKFTNAGAAVSALLEQTATIVSELKGAAPLREVLQSELKLVRQHLANAEAVAREGDEAAAKSAPLFRALIRDLERIRRIAYSAAASLSGSRPTASLPRTTSEAYDVLGVNPDVSESVLKKIVDALRMSWHPDHSRDEEDRRVREDRIRQINAAWELINAKREVA